MRKIALIANVLSLVMLSFAALSPAQATVRDRNQDHRGRNLGGQAIPGGWHIKCIIPFCSNSFEPHGRRPTVQDHRPGANVPPITNPGHPIGPRPPHRPSGPPTHDS